MHGIFCFLSRYTGKSGSAARSPPPFSLWAAWCTYILSPIKSLARCLRCSSTSTLYLSFKAVGGERRSPLALFNDHQHAVQEIAACLGPRRVIGDLREPCVFAEPPTFCLLMLLPPGYSLASLETQTTGGKGGWTLHPKGPRWVDPAP